jgi:enoyl-CoA hydratase
MIEGSGHIIVADDGGVRTITIDRPEAKNALNGAMRRELCEMVGAADRDATVRVVIVTAVDPVFTAGVDFKDITPSSGPTDLRFGVNPGSALRAMTTPVLCAVNGACVSGGLEIALSATFVVASERARFADTHARLGVVPGWGLSALLPRAVGVRKAREMSITGAFVDAAEALRIGLVNHVVAHAELQPFTRALADQIADTPAVAEILNLYDRGEDLSLNAALALEADHVATRTFDVAAFTALGRETAARQRSPQGRSTT